MSYGLYDTKDKCWMGTKPDGPNLYEEEEVARAGATIVNAMFKYRPGRIRAMPFTGKDVTLKDKVDAELTCEEAIEELEKKGKIRE